MMPQISEISENNAIYQFTLSQLNVSLANALRRIVLCEIPTVVIQTEFHATNQCHITINTSRIHNEMI